MSIAPWRILLEKDAAYLCVLAILVLPVASCPGIAFGLAALAAGRYPSIMRRRPLTRWRFTGGSIGFGLAQIALGAATASAEAERGGPVLAGAAALWALSIWLGACWMSSRM